MEKIYLRNFKGFDSQHISFDDINFLVGENSTGKTSVLKLINLLSTTEFWFYFEFNNNEVELGYFEEIKNKQSKDNFFQIGLEKPVKRGGEKKKNKLKNLRVLFEFIEENSVPTLYQTKIQIGNFDVLIKFTQKQITYKLKEISNRNFEQWVLDFDFPKRYKKFPVPSRKLPFFILINFLERQIIGNGKEFEYNFSIGEETLFQNYKWLAPIRAKAKRIYESYKVKFSPEGDHIPSILRQILGGKSTSERNRVISILEKFGKDSNLFDKIEIKELGKKNSSPFEIIVKYNDLEIKLPNVGYGVSQSLPIIIEVLSSKKSFFSIQQPEVHLHPKAQSAIGSFLFNSLINDLNKFVVETHSDFTINRFRYELHSYKEEVNFNSKVLFFQRGSKGNFVSEILINKDGTYSRDIPSSYRDFFIDEELRLLGI